jgi:hypothetical protein
MKITSLIIMLFSLTGCATKETAIPEQQPDHAGAIMLTAGQSVILPAGMSAAVPFGTIVRNRNGNSAVINGHHDTVNASAGVSVQVPAGATGPSDNLVIAKPVKLEETANNPDEIRRLNAIHAEIEARRIERLPPNPSALQYTPEVRMQSRAGDVLFHDLINAPGGIGTMNGVFYPHAKERRIVKIEVIAPYDNNAVGIERWSIGHSDSDAVPYLVRLAPDGHGGTDFVVKHEVDHF